MERLARRIDKIDKQIRQMMAASDGCVTQQIRRLAEELLDLHEQYDRYRFMPHAIHEHLVRLI